jgi:VanZ family protein
MAQRRHSLALVLLVYWIPVAVYLCAIWYLSSQPNLVPPAIPFTGDKLYHFIEFFGLGLLLARAWRATLLHGGFGQVLMIAFACGVLVGASDEYHQSFVPGRDMSVYDLLADAAGLVAAQALYARFARG